jgi:hypothetical protein
LLGDFQFSFDQVSAAFWGHMVLVGGLIANCRHSLTHGFPV